ncbi:MAG: V-type ATP synthase subunit A [Thermoprotei archaeon]|nr:MAG: V-type ATP synthase subunit A [Thermoprotei archaeon]
MRKGVIDRVSGPLVVCSGIRGVAIGEIVEVGSEGLIGEVVRVIGDRFFVQVYESTSGLKPGEGVVATGRRLTAELGPGLLGSIFDGIQRPLPELLKLSGPFIGRGFKLNALPRDRKWCFKPLVRVGDRVGPGDIIGIVEETPMIVHKVMVPPHLRPGEITRIEEGEFTVEEGVATLVTRDGEVEIRLMHEWPVRVARPWADRLAPEEPLLTGQRVIDTFFPISKGGTACVPGGFGTGKTVLLHKISMWSNADVVVYVGCGERGNEMAELLKEFPQLIDPRKGRPVIERSVLIANTSNMPVMAREASVYMGITIAEYYRDMGYDVALQADSTSRWAEAIRELSSRLEEMPVEQGFPAYLPDKLAEVYERAGRVKCLGEPERVGSVTVIAAVSPPGGDYNEPVTIHTLRFVGAMWALDTELAYRRHFPAVNWLRSFSQYADILEEWMRRNVSRDAPRYRRRALALLSAASEIEAIASVVGESALPDDQRLILLVADMLKEGFLRQVALEGEEAFCPPIKQYTLLKMMLDFYDVAYQLVRARVPVDEIVSLPHIPDMIRVKEKPLGEIERVYGEAREALREIADRYGVEVSG